MARTVMQVDYKCSCEEAVKRTIQILANAGYYQIEQNEEMVWTRGTIEPFKTCCIKVEYGKNDMRLFGWILDLTGNEIPLHGITKAMTKRTVKKTMHSIQSAISSI